METMLAKIKNDGWRSQVVRTPDGTVTVGIGQKVTAEILVPDNKMLAHYAERGVTITSAKGKTDSDAAGAKTKTERGNATTPKARAEKSVPSRPSREDLEMAVADAEANLAAVLDSNDLDAIAGAQQALDEAAKALAAA